MIMDYMSTQPMFTKNKKVVIFGLVDSAELAHFYFTNDSEYEVVGFTAHEDYIPNGTRFYKGLPVVPYQSIESEFSSSDYHMFIPMTGIKMNTIRKSIYEDAKFNKNYTMASYISSRCSNFANSIGDNCFILEDNTIQPFTEIGNNVTLWSGNHIGHHGKIEDHVYFTSHAVLSGHCHVKERAWVGVNATIRDGVTIGEGCLVAMGSLITKSTEDGSFYMGSPAKRQEKTALEVY
jgi:sugar O-acyltransferase (sialic acid O-acetyltransferase NeuD family)